MSTLTTVELPSLYEAKLRVVYLRPRTAGEEAIAVGVLHEYQGGIQLTSVENVSAFDALRTLQGNSVVENVVFGLSLLKQRLRDNKGFIDELDSPASNIFLGNSQIFLSEAPAAYARDYLRLVSCLLQERGFQAKKKTITQNNVGDILYDLVSQIDVIAATRLFEGYRLQVSRGRSIKFPIYGKRVIAAPVSMVTKQVSAAKNFAEANCAKLALASKFVNRQATLYVLVPSLESALNQSAIEDAIGEIDFLAEANDVIVRMEKSPSELARLIMFDEKGGA